MYVCHDCTHNASLPDSTCYSPDMQDICSRLKDCMPSPIYTPLQALTIIGVVLSLTGIIATIVTLLLFKWVSAQIWMVSSTRCSMNISIIQETSRARCHQVSHPALHSTILHADCLCVWYWPDPCVRRLYACVCSDPLLFTGGCDVDGSRGYIHVPEAGHCVQSNHHQVYSYRLTCLLV